MDEDLSSTQPACVVLGLGVNGLGVVRSLGRRNISCYGVSSSAADVGWKSRYCKPFRAPSLSEDPEGFDVFFMGFLKSFNQPPVVIPTDDLTVEYLNNNENVIRQFALYSFSPNNSVDILLDKWAFYNHVKRYRTISIPESIVPSEELGNIDGSFFPCVCKPIKSFWNKNTKIEKVQFFSDKIHFMNYFNGNNVDVRDMDKIILQKYVDGPDTNIVFCAMHINDGDVSSVITGRKIFQYPLGFGIASACITEHLPEIEKITKKILVGLGYSGPAEAEFKWDDLKNEFQVIEINPRSWFNNSLSEAAGQDIIYDTYCFAIGDKNKKINEFIKKEIIWIDEVSFVGSVYRSLKKFDIKYYWFVKLLFTKKVFSTFLFRDPAPFMFSIKMLIKDKFGRRWWDGN